MSVQVLINSVDRTKKIDVSSLRVTNVLTQQIDTCSFSIKKYGDHTYTPDLGNTVVIYDDTVKIFAGRIAKIVKNSDTYGIIILEIEAYDYGKELNKRLVNKTYKDTTVNQIISDIISYYDLDDDGFTITNVDCDTTINYISFKFQEVGDCLKELAELSGFDWYVDPEKDIHFFKKGAKSAPFSITDNNGNLINNSLVIREDNTNLRNTIIVRGGDYLASTLSSTIVADGAQKIFNLGYRFGTADVSFTLTGGLVSYGREPRDTNPSLYDAMWNNDEKVLKFRDVRRPSINSELVVRGKPYLPCIIKLKDQESILDTISAEGGTGIHEYLIIDKSINSKEGARDRARAELYTYAQTLSEGEFRTYTSGLRAGQEITINSTLHGVNKTYIINKVQYEMWTHDEMVYSISLVTTKSFGIIEFLQGLLRREKKQIVVRADEELDEVDWAGEVITMSDTVTGWIDKNKQTETITMADTLTAQSMDYEVEFVLGPWTPTPTGGSTDLTAGQTFSASSVYAADPATFAVAKAFDNDDTTRWANNSLGAGEWIKVQFGVAPIINKITIQQYVGFGFKNFKVQGSNDDINWTDLYTGLHSNTPLDATHTTIEAFTFANSTAYTYYRVLAIDIYGTLISVWEMEMMAIVYTKKRQFVLDGSPLGPYPYATT
jgi:hypothetical protein